MLQLNDIYIFFNAPQSLGADVRTDPADLNDPFYSTER